MVVKKRLYKRHPLAPSLDHTRPNSVYPKFPPDLNSFQSDEYFRDGYSYSDLDYQRMISLRSYSKTLDNKRISKSFDLFRGETKDKEEWLDKDDTDDGGGPADENFRSIFDSHMIKLIDEPPELALYKFTFSGIARWIYKSANSIYYFLIGEPIHSSPYIYWLYYYYFFFTEYTLVHITLYFPYLDFFSYYPLFTSFDGVYFNFLDIVVGFYIPTLFLFFFSQYHIFKNFFEARFFVFAGFSFIVLTFSLLPVFYISGFSSVLTLVFFVSIFYIFSTFYFFEFSPIAFDDVRTGGRYTTYFLPAPKDDKSTLLFLPKFYYKFYNWPVTNIEVDRAAVLQSRKRRFTRAPFNTNISKIILHKRRIVKFYENRLKQGRINFHTLPPSLPMLGLVFSNNSIGYSLPEHKQHVIDYPDPEWRPIVESEESDVEESLDEHYYFSMYGRDYINHSLGLSNISFAEFIASRAAPYSADFQFTRFDEDNRQFISSLPSFRMMRELYPYYMLNVWLTTLDPAFSKKSDPNFSFKNTIFKSNSIQILSADIVKQDSEVLYLPYFLTSSIKMFFEWLDCTLDRITRYRYYQFKDAKSLEEFFVALSDTNMIMSKPFVLPSIFYIRLAFFLSRSARSLRRANYDNYNATFADYFSYWLLVIQLEDIYVKLLPLFENIDRRDSRCRAAALCIKTIRRNFDYFDVINDALLVVEQHFYID